MAAEDGEIASEVQLDASPGEPHGFREGGARQVPAIYLYPVAYN